MHSAGRRGAGLLVNCGATSLVALKAQGLDPNAVGAVAVTHLHNDHFGGLPFLILDGQFSHRSAPLLVAGPPGIRSRLAEAMETLFPGSSNHLRFPVQVTELATDGTPAALGAASVRGWQVEHACGAPPLALRVELGGVSFAYSGDTQWTPALAEAARGADLFAAEAYTFDRPIRYHLDYQTLRTHAGEIHADGSCLPTCRPPCSPGSPMPNCPQPTTAWSSTCDTAKRGGPHGIRRPQLPRFAVRSSVGDSP